MTDVGVGIHGYPLVDWDGSHSSDGNLQVGYCPHSSNLFGPWHRPYLSVFEVLVSPALHMLTSD